MSLKKIPISQYKKVAKNSIRAVSLDGKRFVVSSAKMALRKVCEFLISSGLLKKNRVYGFCYSWIGTRPGMMQQPSLLCDGIYLSESGDDTTMYIRLSVLLKRLLIPQERCIIECEVGEEQEERSCDAWGLKEWNVLDEDPDGSVQKRISELRPADFKNLVPYKLGIANKKYKTESWAHLVNTFVVYVFSFLKNGPSVLWDVQNSVHWKHPKMVMREGDRILPLSLPFEMQAAEACWMMGDLINILQFDRYSIYVNCRPAGDMIAVPKTDAFNDKDCAYEQKDCKKVLLKKPQEGFAEEPFVRVVTVAMGRHLRPVFWLRKK